MGGKKPLGVWFDQPGNLPAWLRLLLTGVVPLTLLIVLVGAYWGCRLLDRLLGWEDMLGRTLPWLLGMPALAMGLTLMVWSITYFAAVRGTPVPFNPPRTLVVTGPYRYTRHPMATGFVVALFGLGIWAQSLSIVLVMLPSVIVALAWEVRRFEEPQLERRFGQAYREYKDRVPMLIPRPKGDGPIRRNE